MSTELPTWFTTAVANRPERRELVVDGIPIRYRAWGRAGDPVAVLIHGGAAHSGWWDHVGPHLVDGHRILAIDLSGHGDSGWREGYSLESWAAEVVAVAQVESEPGVPPVLFGHSMGGFVALTAARDHGQQLRAVAAIDSPVKQISPEAQAWRRRTAAKANLAYHADREDLVARFRTLPEDAAGLAFVERYIAEDSVRETAEGWTWKFDPRIFLSTRMEPEALAGAACDVALVRGERGMATRDITEDTRSRLGRDVPVILIPDSGHHIMLDQPIAMIAVLQTLLSQWRTA